MGQNQSYPRGFGGQTSVSAAALSVAASGDAHSASGAEDQPDGSSSTSSRVSSVFFPSRHVNGSGPEYQSQSVRAAIDSFIETCLQSGPDEASSPPAALVKNSAEHIEVITVLEEDEQETKKGEHGLCNVNSSSGSLGKNASTKTNSSNVADNNVDNIKAKQSEKAEEKKSSPSNNVKDGVKLDMQDLQTQKASAQSEETNSSAQRSSPSTVQNSLNKDNILGNEKANTNATMPGSETLKLVPERPEHENLVKKAIFDGNTSENSNSLDGVTSGVRLKTLIDRVLDSSLGVGVDHLKSVPENQKILHKLAEDEKEQANRLASTAKQSMDNQGEAAEGNRSNMASVDKLIDKKMEPMTVSFMDHITKAVERSFSSITEEEERKEKEKALTVRALESKHAAAAGNTKAGDNPGGHYASDGTVSVQDIVDRVISQTEVISKLMTTSSVEPRTESKPLVSSAGTYYPDRLSTDPGFHAAHRPHKDDAAREQQPPARRGRPRMRSPYLDPRESMGYDYHATSRRGSGGAVSLAEDYLQPMHSNMAKYGGVSSHATPPFAAGMVSTSSGSQNYHPGSSVHHSTIGLHRGATGMHPARVAQPGHHSLNVAVTQPPPLLRVNPVERVDRSQHPKLSPQQHAPSRSCSCSACAVYFTREQEMARMLQQSQHPGAGDRTLPPHIPHGPHHSPYQKAQGAVAHGAPQPWLGMTDAKGEKVAAYGYNQAIVHSDAFSAVHTHPGFGIQTGVPLAQQGAYPMNIDSRQESHYAKQAAERAEYQRHPGYDKAGSGVTADARRPYPVSVAAAKPMHVQPSHPHVAAIPVAPKSEAPVLDLTYRRDLPTAVQAASFAGGEEDKPLDLSQPARKSTNSASFADRPNDSLDRQREGQHYGSGYPDAAGLREGERYASGSQHLHKLETSVETYLQKYQHGVARAGPPLNVSQVVPPPGLAYVPSQALAGASVQQGSITTGLPHQSASHGLTSASSQPPHQPTHISQLRPAGPNTYAASSGSHLASSPYPVEPLLSPGGRRPQLHPIPAPNLSTSLGPSPRLAFPCHGGSSGPGYNDTADGAAACRTSLGGSLPTANSRPPPAGSPQAPGPHIHRPFSADFLRPNGSRSVSPPGSSSSEGRSVDDYRRRGSVSRHEPIHNILGSYNPQDILYLICRMCRQTYGSPYGFRKHFRNQHGFEPKTEHCLVQTISQAVMERQNRVGGFDCDRYPAAVGNEYGGTSLSMSSSGGGRIPSPRSDLLRPIADESPRSRGSDSPGEGGELRRRGSFVDKGRPSSAVGTGEEREDTKCLECPECGQTFQLNDFGSYKRHCRQHNQMRAGNGVVNASQVYSCVECQCTFPESHLLQEHLLRHQNHSVVCTICRLSFPSAPSCQDHMLSMHGGSSTSEPVVPSLSSSSSSSSPFFSVPPKVTLTSAATKVSASTASTTAVAIMGFNLQVTTPSDLEIRRLPADHTVTSASPDSSSDNKKSPEPCLVSSSDKEPIKREPSLPPSPKLTLCDGKESPRVKAELSVKLEEKDEKGCALDRNGLSTDNRSISTDGSLSSAQDSEDHNDLFLYKHKKFSAHRKRAGSNEAPEKSGKQPHLELERSNSAQVDNAVPASDKVGGIKSTGSPKAVSESKPATGTNKSGPTRTEARHQMPFVWDRVTRSQAGKTSRSSEYS